MTKKFNLVASICLVFVSFILINLVSKRFFEHYRFDFTEQGYFTLSDGSKNIIHNIKEPITLRLYFSKKMSAGVPLLNDYAEHVKTFLTDYQQLNNKIKLKFIDPEPFSPQEDDALEHGLKNIPVAKNGENFYFGLVGTSATGKKSVINLLSPERAPYLEYDIGKLIYQLTELKKPHLGVISSLPLQGNEITQTPPWLVWQQLAQTYQIKMLSPAKTKHIGSDVDLLLLINPTISRDTQYAIDQFVLRGGHVMVMVDPYTEVLPAINPTLNPVTNNSSFTALFNAWGIEYNSKVAIADRKNARQVRYKEGEHSLITDYPFWLDVNQDGINSAANTRDLKRITLATPGAIEPLQNASTHFSPLLQSTKSTMPISTDKVGDIRTNPPSLLENFMPSHHHYTFAAEITGKAHTAFPHYQSSTHLMQARKPIHVIVATDTDMLYDSFWAQIQNIDGQKIAKPFAHNAFFLLNSLDYLSGNNALINIRSHTPYIHPFTRIENLEKNSAQALGSERQKLLVELAHTQSKLQALATSNSTMTLSGEQQLKLTEFRQQMRSTREQLRQVQHNLEKNIEGLQNRIIWFNILAMPLIIGFFSLLIAFIKTDNRRQRKQLAKARLI